MESNPNIILTVIKSSLSSAPRVSDNTWHVCAYVSSGICNISIERHPISGVIDSDTFILLVSAIRRFLNSMPVL